jgi:hypothetical protein
MAKPSIERLELFEPNVANFVDSLPPNLQVLVLDAPVCSELDALERFADFVNANPELRLVVKNPPFDVEFYMGLERTVIEETI